MLDQNNKIKNILIKAKSENINVKNLSSLLHSEFYNKENNIKSIKDIKKIANSLFSKEDLGVYGIVLAIEILEIQLFLEENSILVEDLTNIFDKIKNKDNFEDIINDFIKIIIKNPEFSKEDFIKISHNLFLLESNNSNSNINKIFVTVMALAYKKKDLIKSEV